MDFLLFANVYIALAAAMVTLQSYALLGAPARLDALVVMVFFATLSVYNVDRIAGARAEDRVDSTRRHRWVRRHPRLLGAVTLVAAAGLGVSLAMLPTRVLPHLLPLAVVSGAYSFPLLRRLPGGLNRLKEAPGLKVLLVAAVWAVATAWLPAVRTGQAFSEPAAAALIALRRFLFVAAITLPFDLRDVSRDAAAGIRTIPMWLGARGTRWLALALLAAFAALCPLRLGSMPGHATALLLSTIPTAAVLLALTPARGDLYYSLLLDGTLIVQSLLVLAAAG